jgi:hypothetical protein
MHWDNARPPYPGLDVFEEEDAPIYFGRDEAIREMKETLERLRREWRSEKRAVLVLGASGSGKSHIPSDLVVDGCPQMSRAAQSLISRWDLMYGRQTSHEIRPIISMGCNFTTKSDGI